VQDVVAHVVGVNGFWEMSVAAGLAGTPTRILAAFDPAATPPLLVDAMRDRSAAEILDQFVTSNTGFLDALAGLDESGWSMLAEAPPGHVTIRMLASHALWDSWIHERDIALALGLAPPVVADEVLSSLRYAAALSPAFLLTAGRPPGAVFAVEATEPGTSFTIEVGESVAVRDGSPGGAAPCLRGDSVALTEALSIRAPLPDSTPTEWAQLLGGLAAVFDSELEFS